MAQIAIAALMVGGTILDAVGNMKHAEGTAQSYEYQGMQDLENAKITRQQTAEEERRERLKNSMTFGSIRASFGASGVTMDGTPKDYLENQIAIGETNAMTIRNQGILQAKALEKEAANYYKAASDARSSGLLYTGGAVLSGAANTLKRVT